MGGGGAQQETGFCKVRSNLRKEEDRQADPGGLGIKREQLRAVAPVNVVPVTCGVLRASLLSELFLKW